MKNKLPQQILNFISLLILSTYSISLVIFVNNPSKTYIENYFAYVVLSIFLVYVIFYRKIFFPKIYIGFVVFFFMSMVLLIFYPSSDSFDLLISLIKIFIFSIIVYNILIFNNSSISIEIGLIIGLLYSIFSGYYFGRDYFVGFMEQRYAGTLENPNHYAFMLTVALLLLIRRFLFLIQSKKKYNQYIHLVIRSSIITLILIISSEVVFYSISRQGILIVLLLLTFLFYQTYRESQTIGKIVLVCIASYISFVSLQIVRNTPFIYNRLGALFTFFDSNSSFEMDTSLIYRFKYLGDAYNLWLENPIFGIGLHQFKHLNQSGVSHNNFLEILVNNGIVGFISYYVFYVYIFLSYIRIKKHNKIDANWLLTVFLMLIIADMTVLTYIEKPNWLIFSIVLFVIHSYKKDDSITLEL